MNHVIECASGETRFVALMAMVLADLPDDVDTLKAMIFALSQEAKEVQAEVCELKAINATAEERNARLTSIIKMLERGRFGTRSEKLKPGGLDDERERFTGTLWNLP